MREHGGRVRAARLSPESWPAATIDRPTLGRAWGLTRPYRRLLDLRTALCDHVQRMPMGFFTRVQTGAVLTRLSTDVVGAQGTVTTLTSSSRTCFWSPPRSWPCCCSAGR